jgi:hypothetical protein
VRSEGGLRGAHTKARLACVRHVPLARDALVAAAARKVSGCPKNMQACIPVGCSCERLKLAQLGAFFLTCRRGHHQWMA